MTTPETALRHEGEPTFADRIRADERTKVAKALHQRAAVIRREADGLYAACARVAELERAATRITRGERP